MSWIITGSQKTINGTLTVGQPYGGGYFAGYISHTADGNPTHALIVAPSSTGASGGGYPLTTNFEWALDQNAGDGINYSTTTIGSVANATFDGAATMTVLKNIGISNFPAAEFCALLSIGGFTDWYLPSRHELDIAYFNLKPTSSPNSIFAGLNSYAVPTRTVNYTENYPSSTSVAIFRTSSEAFPSNTHWTSTELSPSNATAIYMGNGSVTSGYLGKVTPLLVRAFRKVPI